MSRKNFVQVQLAAAATDIQTTLSVKVPVGGYAPPPADGGRLIITDSPGRPLAFEVVTYTGRTGTGPYTLTGVTRGVEGTVGLAWPVDAFVFMGLTAGEFDTVVSDLQSQIDAKAASNDARLSDAREWTAATVDQTEATAGTATVRRAWTAERVAQAVRGGILTGLSTSTGGAIAATDTVLAAMGKLQKQISDAASNLAANVRAVALTGLSTSTGGVIAATDTVLGAMGKLQKQISDAAGSLAADVRAVVLTGLSTSTGGVIAATDTVLGAMGKLQKQITDAGTNLAGNIRSTVLTGYQAGSATALAATDTLLDALGKIQGQINARAPLASPSFSGTPTVPTAAAGTSTTQAASTAFVQSVVNGYLSLTGLTGGTRVLTADEAANAVIALTGALTSNLILEIPTAANRLYSISNGTSGAFTVSVRSGPSGTSVAVAQGKRNLVFTNTSGAYDAINDFDSIALSGAPTAPTAAAGTNTTQIATTAFVNAEIANDAPTKTGGGASGTWPIGISGNAATATTLSGLTASVAELNYCDGVTSAIQAQLDGKAASNHTHSYAPLNGAGTSGTWPIGVTGNAATATAMTLGSDAVNIDNLTGNGVTTNVTTNTTGTFNGFQPKNGVLVTYNDGTNRTQIHYTSNGIIWSRSKAGANAYSDWRFSVLNDSASLSAGSCTFNGNGAITMLRNTANLAVGRDSAGVYSISGVFGTMATNMPAVAMTNAGGRVNMTQGGNGTNLKLTVYGYNNATPSDTTYLNVILGN